MTALTIPNRIMRPVASRPARRAVLIGFGAAALTGLLLIAGISAALAFATAGTILPGVTVAGVEVAGLSPVAAAQRLTERLPSLSAGEATITVVDAVETVPYDEIGRGYEMEAMVDAAFGIGRSGNVVTDGVARLRSLVHPAVFGVIVHAYDPKAIAAVSAEIAERFTVPAVDAEVIRDGIAFEVTPSQNGISLDPAVVRAALATAVDSSDPADVALNLEPTIVRPAVSTAVAESVADAARTTVAPLTLEIPGAAEGEQPLSISSETIASWLGIGADYGDVSDAIRLDEAAALSAIAAFAPAIDQEAVNASISVASGGGLGGVIAGQDGRQLDVEATGQALLAALEKRAAGTQVASLALSVNVAEPSFTTAEALGILPQMQLVSSWTTYYVPGEGNGYGNNINIGAWDIDGRNLLPGEWFSFWGSIGPVTVERGYSYGGAIINGRSTQGVAIGGGICSTSTTIFNAALRAGLEMGVRLNHFYYIDRYPDGLDATTSIMDGWTQDMTFRNDTDNPIVVRGFGGNGSVTFQIWSVPLGRTVVITDPLTSNHRRAIDTTEVVASMAPGTSKRVEYPHDGHDVSRTRVVYDADGFEIHRNDYFSHYATVNGIVQVGPTPEPPPPPAEPPPASG